MSSMHATLVSIAHKRLDRADAMLASQGATWAVIEAYAYTAHAFKLARVWWWAALATQRAERCTGLL